MAGPFLKIYDELKKLLGIIKKAIEKFRAVVAKLKDHISTNVIAFDNLCAGFELNTYKEGYSMEFIVKGGVYIGGTKDENNKQTIDKTFTVPKGSSLFKGIGVTIIKMIRPAVKTIKKDIDEFRNEMKKTNEKIAELEMKNKQSMDAAAEDKITTTRSIEVSLSDMYNTMLLFLIL